MRKKSHILLARYLADQMQTTASLQSHRKAFCLGSILPDIKPSFITRRHEFYGTFDDVKNRMKELADIGLLHTDCMTVTGKTIGENIANAVNRNPEVIRPVDHP